MGVRTLRKSADYQGPDMTDFGHRVLQDPAFAEQYKEEHQKFCDAILNDAEFAEKYGELGNIYGAQWRHWETKDGSFIDQLANVIEMIKTNPDSRRLIVSLGIQKMCLQWRCRLVTLCFNFM